MTTQLLIWTSPRDVVAWADDAAEAGRARAALEAAGCSWWPVQTPSQAQANRNPARFDFDVADSPA